jgi:hypothetical protein
VVRVCAIGRAPRRTLRASEHPIASGARALAVIFGERDDATLLGAVTLESLGFVLDAICRDLVPLPMVVDASLSRHERRGRPVETA